MQTIHPYQFIHLVKSRQCERVRAVLETHPHLRYWQDSIGCTPLFYCTDDDEMMKMLWYPECNMPVHTNRMQHSLLMHNLTRRRFPIVLKLLQMRDALSLDELTALSQCGIRHRKMRILSNVTYPNVSIGAYVRTHAFRSLTVAEEMYIERFSYGGRPLVLTAIYEQCADKILMQLAWREYRCESVWGESILEVALAFERYEFCSFLICTWQSCAHEFQSMQVPQSVPVLGSAISYRLAYTWLHHRFKTGTVPVQLTMHPSWHRFCAHIGFCFQHGMQSLLKIFYPLGIPSCIFQY